MPHTTRTAFHSALAAEDEHIPIEVARSKPYGMPEHYTSVTSTCFFFPADGFFLAPLALAMNLPFDLPLAGRGLALAPPGLKRPAPLFPPPLALPPPKIPNADAARAAGALAGACSGDGSAIPPPSSLAPPPSPSGTAADAAGGGAARAGTRFAPRPPAQCASFRLAGVLRLRSRKTARSFWLSLKVITTTMAWKKSLRWDLMPLEDWAK